MHTVGPSHPWLVESVDAKPKDAKGQQYTYFFKSMYKWSCSFIPVLFKGQLCDYKVSYSYIQHLLRTYHLQVTKLSLECTSWMRHSPPLQRTPNRDRYVRRKVNPTFELQLGAQKKMCATSLGYLGKLLFRGCI